MVKDITEKIMDVGFRRYGQMIVRNKKKRLLRDRYFEMRRLEDVVLLTCRLIRDCIGCREQMWS